MRPIARIGVNDSSCPAPRVGVAQPAPMTSAVPSTGTSVAIPGYCVVEFKKTQVSTTATRPTQPAAAVTSGDRRLHRPAVRATTPPAANSQARVGIKKNPAGGHARVTNSAATRDVAPISTRTTRYVFGVMALAPSRRRRRITQATPSMMAGHTK
ncbi:hypothetical protein MSTO_12010 [Mycobacterium stomatepiae]|uniref:Uncharacterized protein n=1 Tax=Mycobacterium stomatepiae TaxID=470076 RepID=A0A7I7Q4R9_9MYCO|nr:hypothetical protein MSTO_12010 [Mycobacterium stomatepiae]